MRLVGEPEPWHGNHVMVSFQVSDRNNIKTWLDMSAGAKSIGCPPPPFVPHGS